MSDVLITPATGLIEFKTTSGGDAKFAWEYDADSDVLAITSASVNLLSISGSQTGVVIPGNLTVDGTIGGSIESSSYVQAEDVDLGTAFDGAAVITGSLSVSTGSIGIDEDSGSAEIRIGHKDNASPRIQIYSQEESLPWQIDNNDDTFRIYRPHATFYTITGSSSLNATHSMVGQVGITGTVSASAGRFGDSGSVGIGTGDPDYPLHVEALKPRMLLSALQTGSNVGYKLRAVSVSGSINDSGMYFYSGESDDVTRIGFAPSDSSISLELFANDHSRFNGPVTASDTIIMEGIAPKLKWSESDQDADNRHWDMVCEAAQFRFRLLDDGEVLRPNIFLVERTGGVIDTFTIGAFSTVTNAFTASAGLTVTGDVIFNSADLVVSDLSPYIELKELNADADEERWWVRAVSSEFLIQAVDDSTSAINTALSIIRTNSTVDGVEIHAPFTGSSTSIMSQSLIVNHASSIDADMPVVHLYRAEGDAGSKSVIADNNTYIGEFCGYGWDGSAYGEAANMKVKANGTWSPSGHGSILEFWAGSNSGTTNTLALAIYPTTVACIFYAGLKVTTDLEIDGALNHDGSTVGFYNTTPITKQTSVSVDAAGIHAALVALGLIT